MVKELSDDITETQILHKKTLKLFSHWRKLSMINGVRALLSRFSKTRILFIFFVYIFIHISANMSPFGLKFSQMIFHTETRKLIFAQSNTLTQYL